MPLTLQKRLEKLKHVWTAPHQCKLIRDKIILWERNHFLKDYFRLFYTQSHTKLYVSGKEEKKSVFFFTRQWQETKLWSRNSLHLQRRSLIKWGNLKIIQIKVAFISSVGVQPARLAAAPEEKWNSSILRERQSHARVSEQPQLFNPDEPEWGSQRNITGPSRASPCHQDTSSSSGCFCCTHTAALLAGGRFRFPESALPAATRSPLMLPNNANNPGQRWPFSLELRSGSWRASWIWWRLPFRWEGAGNEDNRRTLLLSRPPADVKPQ